MFAVGWVSWHYQAIYRPAPGWDLGRVLTDTVDIQPIWLYISQQSVGGWLCIGQVNVGCYSIGTHLTCISQCIDQYSTETQLKICWYSTGTLLTVGWYFGSVLPVCWPILRWRIDQILVDMSILLVLTDTTYSKHDSIIIIILWFQYTGTVYVAWSVDTFGNKL